MCYIQNTHSWTLTGRRLMQQMMDYCVRSGKLLLEYLKLTTIGLCLGAVVFFYNLTSCSLNVPQTAWGKRVRCCAPHTYVWGRIHFTSSCAFMRQHFTGNENAFHNKHATSFGRSARGKHCFNHHTCPCAVVNLHTASLLLSQYFMCFHVCPVSSSNDYPTEFPHNTSNWIKCCITPLFALLFLTEVINEPTAAVNAIGNSRASVYWAMLPSSWFALMCLALLMSSRVHRSQLVFNVTAFKPCWALLQAHALVVVIHCRHGKGQLREPHCDVLKIYLTLVQSMRGIGSRYGRKCGGTCLTPVTHSMHGKGTMAGGAENRKKSICGLC